MLQIQKFKYTQLCKVLSEINNNFAEIKIYALFPNIDFSIKLQVDLEESLFRSEWNVFLDSIYISYLNWWQQQPHMQRSNQY